MITTSRARVVQDAPWHNPDNQVISSADLMALMRIKTRPTGKHLQEYRKAFVHSSYMQPPDAPALAFKCDAIIPLQPESNERLEFLGDAVLDLIMAEYLYERYKDEDEGFLTQMRMSIVNGKMLARLGRILNIQKYLLMSLQSEHLRNTDNIVEDTLEAFIGALYKDRGMKAAKDWFVSFIEDNLDFTQLITTSERDMLNQLYKEKFGSQVQIIATRMLNNQFKVVILEDNTKTCIGEGYGPTRRIATDNAAREGLRADNIGKVMMDIRERSMK